MWKTDVLEPKSMRGFLTNVRLPTTNGSEVSRLSQVLLDEYGTFVVCEGDGRTYTDTATQHYWMRVSAQAYLGLDDFEWLGKAVLKILSN